jgi:formate dehydrogenase major subunit
MYAGAKTAAILWGMGVTQFYQGVETVRSLTSLAMLTGNLGKADVGVNPVRGQNNVQGACDMGALPDTYPGYQYVKFPENREKFAKAWGVESLPEHTGYRISELPHRAAHGEVRAAYIMGEDPLQTDAELSAVRKGFEDLELVIVQDIFMTKTAAAADVILPSTSWGEHEGVYTAADRGFQRFFKAVEPKWDLKTDWQIISEIATRMGYPMHYNNTQEIWDELRICARTSTAPPTKKWVSWATSSGRAAMSPTPTRGRRISLKRSSTPRTGWRSSSPATGSRRSINSPTSIRWCSPPCVKWATTPAVR